MSKVCVNNNNIKFKTSMKRCFFILVAVCLLSSCSMTKLFPVSPNDEFTAKYVGKTVADIVQEFGNPFNVGSDGKSGMILSYEHVVEEFMSANLEDAEMTGGSGSGAVVAMNYSGDEYAESSQSDAPMGTSTVVYKHFYVDKNSVCYKVDTNDYLKGGLYRKYFNRVAITEVSLVAVLATLINLFVLR